MRGKCLQPLGHSCCDTGCGCFSNGPIRLPSAKHPGNWETGREVAAWFLR